MKRIVKYIIFALIGVIFIGTFVFLFKNSRPDKIQYQELEAVLGDVHRTTVVTGKITPRNEVNVKPQINGIIAELLKEAGQQVKEGEVIAKLRVIPDMNSLSSAQSRVRLAEINLKQATTNYEREKALFDKKLVSDEEYDQVLQAYNQAKEEKAAAQESLEVIRDGVSSSNKTGSSTLIRSTITGLILTYYENAFEAIPVLVSFIPMLMDTSGNCGSQASTLIIRGLALDQIHLRDVFRVMFKAFRVLL